MGFWLTFALLLRNKAVDFQQPFFLFIKVYIRSMVSLRCKMIVKAELERLGVAYSILDLGMVEVSEALTYHDVQLKENLLRMG